MNEFKGNLSKAAEAVGTWLMISGVLVIGVPGLVVLGILAYATYVSDMALAVVCMMLLATPLVFLLAWTALLCAGLIQEAIAVQRERATESQSR